MTSYTPKPTKKTMQKYGCMDFFARELISDEPVIYFYLTYEYHKKKNMSLIDLYSDQKEVRHAYRNRSPCRNH